MIRKKGIEVLELIIGIGTDLIELSRIESVLKNKGDLFLKRILTEKEIERCPLHPKRKVEYIAGRFAGKEAVAKALSTGIGNQLSWQDIEIINQTSGKPEVKIMNDHWNNRDFITHISISHSKTMALAKVIIEER